MSRPSACDLETSVVDWLIDHPEVESLFRQWGIDTSCAGKSLEWTARRAGLDPTSILRQLDQQLGIERKG